MSESERVVRWFPARKNAKWIAGAGIWVGGWVGIIDLAVYTWSTMVNEGFANRDAAILAAKGLANREGLPFKE